MNGMMKKAGLAVAMAATALTASAPADAQRFGGFRGGYHGYHGGYRGYRGGNVAGAALLGGIVGLGVGAAIAGNRGGYYGGPGYYAPPPPPPPPVYRGYYGGYYGGYAGPRCWSQWRFDPYWGRNVSVRVCD